MLKKLACLSVITLMAVSCQKQTFVVSKDAKYTQMPLNPTFQEWDHQFLWGLVPTSKHNPIEMCKGNVDIVGTKMSFLNGLLNGITYGIYSPRTYQVQCSK